MDIGGHHFCGITRLGGKMINLLSGPGASVLRAIWSLTIIGRNHSSGFDRIWLINNSKLDFKLDPFKNVFCSFD